MSAPGLAPFTQPAAIGNLRLHPLAPDLSVPAGAAAGLDAPPESLVLFAPSGAYLHPQAAAYAFAAATERPDVGVFYADEAVLRGARAELQLKPRFNPALAQASAYMGALAVVRAPALARLGGLNIEAGTAALYDLVLRAMAGGVGVEGIRETLVAHRDARPEPTAEHRRAALERFVAAGRPGWGVLDGLAPSSLRLRRRFDRLPAVTLVTPTRQSRAPGGEPFVVRLLESLRATAWPHDRLEVLIGDDVEDGSALGDLGRFPFRVRRVLTRRAPGEPFNYSAKMNTLWPQAATEQLVLINDDVEVIAPDWLEAMMGFAVEADVGGVGARLVYPNGALQHAGMAGGLFGTFAHPWIGQPAEAASYGEWARVQRDWSAVTGAVFATRRSALEAVNGFDESFALEYNDVDLCLRMGLLGYRIVQAPDALLRHHERASRGRELPKGSQTARFLQRWEQVIQDDPAYHPGLTTDSFAVQPKPASGAWYAPLLV